MVGLYDVDMPPMRSYEHDFASEEKPYFAESSPEKDQAQSDSESMRQQSSESEALKQSFEQIIVP